MPWKQPRKCPSGKGVKRDRCREALEIGLSEKPALFQSKELPHKDRPSLGTEEREKSSLGASYCREGGIQMSNVTWDGPAP